MNGFRFLKGVCFSLLGPEMNEFAFLKGGIYIPAPLQVLRGTFVNSFHMSVCTALAIFLYLESSGHTDGMIKDKNIKTHPTYKTGNHITITVSVVSAVWKKLLRKSMMSTSVKAALHDVQIIHSYV